MCETGHNNLTFTTVEKKLDGNTLRHTLNTVILLITANFKDLEHFPPIEKFKKTNFAANHFEYV